MKYVFLLTKRWIEDLLMFPLILLGRGMSFIKPLGREYETFYFFPFYHIGGAEKVHLNIAKATGNKNCIIFFTRKSHNSLFLDEFRSSGCEIRDISKYTDNKWIYFANIFFRGLVSGYINKQRQRPLVFNGQCNFGYKLSPWIRKQIPQIELIHSLCSFSYIRIPFLPFIDHTVMISKVRIAEHVALYKQYGIPTHYASRIQFIINGIELSSPKPTPKQLGEDLTVLYVGRASPEKRVHLVAEMARRLQDQKNISFQFLGDVQASIPRVLWPYCKFWGNQSEEKIIDKIYIDADALILVSDTEGFPMVIMEAMAKGLVIITTSVGEIPLHVISERNGYLLDEYVDEEAVIENGIEVIVATKKNASLFSKMSRNNIDYAYEHFGMDQFVLAYQQLFHQMRTKADL